MPKRQATPPAPDLVDRTSNGCGRSPSPAPAEELVRHNFEGDVVKTANEVPVFISRLRGKLGKRTIETIFGYGYRLTEIGAGGDQGANSGGAGES